MGFLGALGGAIVGGIKGLVTGGPIGAVTGVVGGVIGGIKTSGGGSTPYPVGTSIIAPSMPSMGGITAMPAGFLGSGGGGGGLPSLPQSFPGSVPVPGIGGAISRFLPGGQTGYTGAPPGYHINKAYVRHLRAESLGRKSTDPFKAPRAVNAVVKNRKMNPLNPRALRHALRRQGAAVSLMRRALRGSGYTVKRSGLGKAGRGRKRR